MTKKKSPSRKRRFLLLVILAALVAGVLFISKKEAIVRQVVRQELEIRFPEYQIQVSSVRTLESKGVLLYGLQVRIPEENGNAVPFFEADEVLIQTPITISAWFQGEIQPQKIKVTRPVFVLNSKTVDAIRRFTSQNQPAGGEVNIPIQIRDGSVAVTSQQPNSLNSPLTVVYSGIDVFLVPPDLESSPAPTSPPPEQLPHLSLTGNSEDSLPAAKAEQAPSVSRPLWQVRGLCRNPYIKEVKLEGNFSSDLTYFSVSGNIESLELDPLLTLPFFSSLSLQDEIQSFQARTSLSFRAERDTAVSPDLKYCLDGELFHGSFSTTFLEHPVSDIFARYQITESEAKIERATARSGSALLLAAYSRQGTGTDAKWDLKTQVQDFQLNSGLITRIPYDPIQKISAYFDGLKFSANAKLSLNMSGTGPNLNPPEVTVSCKGLTMVHESVPFTPEPLSGILKLEESGHLRFLFQSDKEDRKLQISGDFPNILHEKSGIAKLQAEQIPFDSRLLDSIPAKYRNILLELHPSGTLSGTVFYQRSEKDEKLNNFQISLLVEGGSLNYDLFPYPVSGISGNISYKNGNWQFTDFRGENGSTEITASGTAKSDETNAEFQLNLHASRFPLGDEFRNALVDPAQKELLDRIHLRGEADADVGIRYLAQEDRLDLTVNAGLIPQETSIQPDDFPYLMNELEGNVEYQNGNLTVRNLRGRNGTASFNASVTAAIEPNDGLSIEIFPLTISQLPFDRQLQNAVPPGLLTLIEELEPKGCFSAEGGLKWRRVSSNAPIEFACDTDITLHNNSLKYGKEITGICGKGLIRGYTDGTTSAAHGYLKLDSLFAGSLQATQAEGPFYADKSTICFGTAVPAPQSLILYRKPLLQELLKERASRPDTGWSAVQFAVNTPISANFSGGKAVLNAVVTPGSQAPYHLEFHLKDGNLNELIRDMNENAQRLDGKISLFANIQGEGKNRETAKGSGGIAITDASLYELPALMQVFKSLRVNEPDRAAFNTSFVDFQIYGNRLKLDRVLLEGESLTLFGDGWLSLEGGGEPTIDLTLNSRLSQVQSQTPILSEVLGSAGDQLAQFKVEGPLSSASVRQDNFPGIKKAIWSIFSDEEK